MPNADYLPLTDDALVVWYQNFTTKFATHSATLGFTDDDIEAVQNDNAMLKFVVDLANAYKQEAKERTQYKETVVNARPGTPTVAVPTNPTIAPPAVLPAPGIVGRLRTLVNRIKAAPAYTPAIGKDLNVIAPEITIDPNAKPSGSVAARGGSVIEIKFVKGRYDGVQIESQRGTDTDWTPLDKALRSPFFDARAPVVQGTPELRRYRMRFLKGNAVVGALSDVLTVTTIP